jgi:SAM-dependent methyltransferase
MSIDVSGIKAGQKMMWSVGDYPEIARRIEEVADVLVAEVGAAAGLEMLDVATGSGNVAIPAARAGANVTGLDLTPELLVVARARAAEAGVDVNFIEGDAEELPFESDSFDIVTSCFGVMFAPRHEQAAGELMRVARPGSTIGIAAWTPEGLNGRMFGTVGSYMPPPPAELKPPVMWGTEDHVRSLFAEGGAALSFERRTVTFSHDSPESWVEYNERILGPAIMAKAALEPQGRYDELRTELIGLYSDANEAVDGTFRANAEYLLTIARVPA